MRLTLTIRNAQALENGSPLSLVLDERGATIGRSPTSEWCLPDPSLYISSKHCDVVFNGGTYQLIDNSTNGTFLFGQSARMAGPHTIGHGDVFVIGQYEITATFEGQAAPAAPAPAAAQWKGWDAAGDATPAPPASQSSWGAPPPAPAISGTGPMSQNWDAPASSGSGWGAAPASAASAPSPAPAGGGWGAAPSPAPAPAGGGWGAAPAGETPSTASDWSAPAGSPRPQANGDDIWGQFAASNVVDWARGGFGAPPPSPPIAAAPSQPATAASVAPSKPAPAPSAAAKAPGAGTANAAALVAATGLQPEQLKCSDAELLAQSGGLLRRLVGGLVVMLEARARAKSQMGAQSTSLEFDGNNPLKFARTPEQALQMLLNPPERGFMPSERAIEDAFQDLQAHQVATLKAMQGALRATLDRFSPRSIRARAQAGGLMEKIMPAAKDAALWRAYEKEFSGVALGSDEAFMDMFAKEFKAAYEELARKR